MYNESEPLIRGREYNIGGTNKRYVGIREDSNGWKSEVFVSGGPNYHSNNFADGIDLRPRIKTFEPIIPGRDPSYVKSNYIGSNYNPNYKNVNNTRSSGRNNFQKETPQQYAARQERIFKT